MMKRKRATAERYVRLTHRMMQTQAWQNLDGNARAVYLEVAMLYRGNNNGRIGFSARQARRAIPISRVTAFRALVALQDRGFIVAMTKGRFDRQRHTTEWRMTEFRCDVTGSPATRDFETWTTATILPLRPRGESAERGIDG
jgi:hypothetical protein